MLERLLQRKTQRPLRCAALRRQQRLLQRGAGHQHLQRRVEKAGVAQVGEPDDAAAARERRRSGRAAAGRSCGRGRGRRAAGGLRGRARGRGIASAAGRGRSAQGRAHCDVAHARAPRSGAARGPRTWRGGGLAARHGALGQRPQLRLQRRVYKAPSDPHAGMGPGRRPLRGGGRVGAARPRSTAPRGRPAPHLRACMLGVLAAALAAALAVLLPAVGAGHPGTQHNPKFTAAGAPAQATMRPVRQALDTNGLAGAGLIPPRGGAAGAGFEPRALMQRVIARGHAAWRGAPPHAPTPGVAL